MTCLKCGADLRADDLFCPKCGFKIEDLSENSQAKLDEIVDYGFEEEEEDLSEREESQRIVEGFFRENKKQEQLQRVLDQACEALRRDGVIVTEAVDVEKAAETKPETETAETEAETAETEAETAETEPEAETEAETAEAEDSLETSGPIEEELEKTEKEIQEAKETIEGLSRKAKGWLGVLIVLLVLTVVLLLVLTVGRETSLGKGLMELLGTLSLESEGIYREIIQV